MESFNLRAHYESYNSQYLQFSSLDMKKCYLEQIPLLSYCDA